MVCQKCSQKQPTTSLATPGVKRRSEIYYGSPASTSSPSSKPSLYSPLSARNTTQKKPSATLGQTGISKSKLLSKAAKNPYASYAASCRNCSKKVEGGKVLCHGCAYKSHACAMCGKSEGGEGLGAMGSGKIGKEGKGKGEVVKPVISGWKFSAK